MERASAVLVSYATLTAMKLAIVIALFFALGVASGAYLSRPPKVKAATNFHLQKLRTSQFGDAITFIVSNDDYVGFSCTAQDCYILTR